VYCSDIPDQPSIVRQYMRHTTQLNSAATIPHAVRRGLQLYESLYVEMLSLIKFLIRSATSEPKGPVYLWARREIMEEELDYETFRKITTSVAKAPPIAPGALSSDGEYYAFIITKTD